MEPSLDARYCVGRPWTFKPSSSIALPYWTNWAIGGSALIPRLDEARSVATVPRANPSMIASKAARNVATLVYGKVCCFAGVLHSKVRRRVFPRIDVYAEPLKLAD